MQSTQPITHSTPPETIEILTLKIDATAPASKLPSAGPEDQLSISIDARRPRSESGIVWFQITDRNTPLIMSAAPAMARNSTASHRLGANPNPMIASPQMTAATATPMPCRWMRFVQPLVAENMNDPRAGAA